MISSTWRASTKFFFLHDYVSREIIKKFYLGRLLQKNQEVDIAKPLEVILAQNKKRVYKKVTWGV